MTRRQRRDVWDKFVKTLERDIRGTQKRGFKIFKRLQLQEAQNWPDNKTEWKEYYGNVWNEQGSKGEEGTEEERKSDVTEDNEDMTKIEELNKLLKQANNRKSCGLDNLPMELWKFGGTKVRIKFIDCMSEPIHINKGLRQGCALSLVLFNIYINKIIQEFKIVIKKGIQLNNRKLVNTILYADGHIGRLITNNGTPPEHYRKKVQNDNI